MLERTGYAITLAKGCRAAVSDFESAQFDLVLMDIEMPESGGVEACRIVRERGGPRGPHVVALTGNAIVVDRGKYLSWGFDGYIAKPLNVCELRVELRRAGQKRGKLS